MKDGVALVVSFCVCFAVAGLGGWWTASEIPTWYAALRKPSWNPPSWVFGPVWTLLYVMMAMSAWMVWRRGNSRPALALFAAQLAMNLAWSWIFFRCHAIGWALAEIAVLWVLIEATIAAFWGRSRMAAMLLVPYLAWVGFATALNAAIWRLNVP